MIHRSTSKNMGNLAFPKVPFRTQFGILQLEPRGDDVAVWHGRAKWNHQTFECEVKLRKAGNRWTVSPDSRVEPDVEGAKREICKGLLTEFLDLLPGIKNLMGFGRAVRRINETNEVPKPEHHPAYVAPVTWKTKVSVTRRTKGQEKRRG